MTDEELPTDPRLEVLPETGPVSAETSDGMVWVPTSRGLFGDLTDWQLVRQEVAHEYDARLWGPL